MNSKNSFEDGITMVIDIGYPPNFITNIKKGIVPILTEVAKNGIVLSFLADKPLDGIPKLINDTISNSTIILDVGEMQFEFERECEIIKTADRLPRDFPITVWEQVFFLSDVVSGYKTAAIDKDSIVGNPFYYTSKLVTLEENTEKLHFAVISTHKELIREEFLGGYFKNLCKRYGEVKKQKKPKDRDPITSSIRHEVFKRDKYKCVECGSTKEERTLHVDHIIPKSKGGTDELDNLQTLCEVCNLAKSDRNWKGEVKKWGR